MSMSLNNALLPFRISSIVDNTKLLPHLRGRATKYFAMTGKLGLGNTFARIPVLSTMVCFMFVALAKLLLIRGTERGNELTDEVSDMRRTTVSAYLVESQRKNILYIMLGELDQLSWSLVRYENQPRDLGRCSRAMID